MSIEYREQAPSRERRARSPISRPLNVQYGEKRSITNYTYQRIYESMWLLNYDNTLTDFCGVQFNARTDQSFSPVSFVPSDDPTIQTGER